MSTRDSALLHFGCVSPDGAYLVRRIDFIVGNVVAIAYGSCRPIHCTVGRHLASCTTMQTGASADTASSSSLLLNSMLAGSGNDIDDRRPARPLRGGMVSRGRDVAPLCVCLGRCGQGPVFRAVLARDAMHRPRVQSFTWYRSSYGTGTIDQAGRPTQGAVCTNFIG